MESAMAKPEGGMAPPVYLYPEDDGRYLPSLDLNPENASEAGKSYLKQCHQNIELLLKQHCHPASLIRLRAKMIDKLILALFHLGGEVRCALMAQGGYGRQEMNLHSDLDLLFIISKKKAGSTEAFIEGMLYHLWDMGLEVGHAVRTVAECHKGFFEDVTIMTALLDARYLAGKREMADSLMKTIRQALKPESAQKRLIRVKLDEWKGRIQKWGGSVYMLEPHVRDSLGGLRDLQLPLWMAKIKGKKGTYEELLEKNFLSREEYVHLIEGRYFLWRVRNELHLIIGKKVDVLTFAHQETIAARMGYQESGGILGVERFMQDYYRHANRIAGITEMVIRHLTASPSRFRLLKRFQAKPLSSLFAVRDRQIALRSKEEFQRNPSALMQIFVQVQNEGIPLHPDTKDLIRFALHHVDDAFRAHPKNQKLFRGMLGCYRNLGLVLSEMHEAHFLEEFLPEFKKILCRVQHDVYHVYTIDIHSVFAVRELSRLCAGDYEDKFKKYHQILNEVSQPEILTLGVFLHDIGKGEGGNHSIKGAITANAITSRLEFSPEEQKGVEFLIMSHLLMPHLSQRRDLEDQELIISFARSMGTVDRLNMLFLLTWADIRAVGPNTWSDWKGTLLERLYDKTREVITRGEFSKEKTRERIDRVKLALIEKMGSKHDRSEIICFLGLMPPRYFFAVNDHDVENHISLWKRGENEDIVVDVHLLPDLSMNELQIYTLNTPRVLAQVTGVCSAHALNILKVDLFQTSDGHILIVIDLTDIDGAPLRQDRIFEVLSENLKNVMTGKVKVEDLIAKRQVPDYLAKKQVQKAETRIVIDNDVSAYYTVIDVYTHDRLGLLYDVMKALNQQGCYVDFSKISTKVEQVSDVFYVKDIFGKKIISKEKLGQLKEALLAVLNG